MAKLFDTKHRHWDDWLPSIAFAYHTSVNEVTGYTPFYLMFGREASIPADLMYGAPPDSEQAPASYSEFVNDQQSRLRESCHLTHTALQHHAQRRKKAYDLRTKPNSYPVGSWVWCLDP